MKVLQVNNVYAEKSTGKLTQEIHQGLLDAGWESVVVYGRGKGMQAPGVIRLCPNWYGKWNALRARLTGMPYGGCFLSTRRLIRIIQQEKPDIVHLQCINGNFVNIYKIIAWLKKQQVKTVVSLHAEFLYTGNCGHAFDCTQWQHGCKRCPDRKRANKSWFWDKTAQSWEKMKNSFAGFERDCVIVPVSRWTESRARQSDILSNFRYQTIPNGVNTEVFFCPDGNQKVQSGPTVLNVTAHFSAEQSHPKGGWYLIQLAKRMPEVHFLVAGKAGQSTEVLPENLTLLGEISDQHELAALYQQADLSILVSQRETFSMPCAESLCCGTPIVGFQAGAPEQIALPEYSEFVAQGDLEALERAVRRWLMRTDLVPGKIADCAKRVYSAETMVKTFLSLYRSIYENNKIG